MLNIKQKNIDIAGFHSHYCFLYICTTAHFKAAEILSLNMDAIKMKDLLPQSEFLYKIGGTIHFGKESPEKFVNILQEIIRLNPQVSCLISYHFLPIYTRLALFCARENGAIISQLWRMARWDWSTMFILT